MASPNQAAAIQNLLKSGVNLEGLNIECAKVVNSQGQVVQVIPLKNAKNLASLPGLAKYVTVATGGAQGTAARFVQSPLTIPAGNVISGISSQIVQPQQFQFIQGTAPSVVSSSAGFAIPSVPGSISNAVTVLSQSGVIPSSAAAVLASGKSVAISPAALRNVGFALKIVSSAGGMPAGTVLTTTTSALSGAGPSGVGDQKKRVTVRTADPAVTLKAGGQHEFLFSGSSSDSVTGLHAVYGRPSPPATPQKPATPDLSLLGRASPASTSSPGIDILDRAMAVLDSPVRSSPKSNARGSSKKNATPASILDHSSTARKNKRESEEPLDANDPKRRKVDKPVSSKGLRHFSMRVCQKVQKKKTTTYNEVADELVVELSDPLSSNVDQKNIRRRVYDALNVLMAMGMIAKEKKEIRWLGLPTCSDNSYKKLLEEKENLMKANLRKRQTLYELLLQIVCFKNLVARNKERCTPDNPSGEPGTSASASMEIPDVVLPGSKNRLPVPFLVISTPKETVIDCNMSHDRSEYLLSFSDAFELSDDFVILKQMGLAHGLEKCNATDEQIAQALPHIPPAFHQFFRDIAKAPPIPQDILNSVADDPGPANTGDEEVPEEEDILNFRGITPSPPPVDYFDENDRMDPGWWSKKAASAKQSAPASVFDAGDDEDEDA